MNLKPISYSNIIAIANAWRDMGGALKIDFGALEPLLWRDGQYRIHDIVSALTKMDFKVSMTTNGQLLETFAEKLAFAGLSQIRTSWHSTDPIMFKEISGGYGNYSRFMHGITLAIESGIKIAFNRVLLKGYTDDIADQLSFIEYYQSRLKFYTLLWTPENILTKKSFYQDWRPIVRSFVLPHTLKITRIRKQLGRDRLKFHLLRGGSVEIKLGDNLNRNIHPCILCSFKKECEEEFGDYIRIDPRFHLYFCYLRRDLGFSISEHFRKPDLLKQKIQEKIRDVDVKSLLSTTSLRLTLTPFCNFNCRTPGTKKGWCTEEPGDYIYPQIRTSLFKKGLIK